ncbi:MAG: DUF2513 domain-containing protein [Lachnospiraceae bacterium]|nr:DUF2513 domain-containing protein [Lachnospiraceae bacterium]
MKLNPDCTRDILLIVESLPDIKHYYRFDETTIPALFPKYSFEEVMYHLRQCELNGFLFEPSHTMNYGSYTVSDLTPKGHEFLNNIRADNVWNHVKVISSKIGSNSLSALFQIAATVVQQLIQAQLGLTK